MKAKLMTLLVAVATVSAVNAGWYDDNGVYHHGLRPRHVAGDVVEGTAHATERAVEGTGDVVAGVLSAPFGGRTVDERIEDRRQRREARRSGNYRGDYIE